MSLHRAVLVGLAVVVALGSLTLAQPGQGQGAARPGGRGGQVGPPRDPAQAAAGAPRGTATIRGVVLAADSGAPIRRAQVRAFAAGAGSRLATTDAQGRFEFKELAPGRYTLSATKGGFVGLQYGQRRPSESGTPLEIADRQIVDKLVMALPRGSVISGRVFDEFGEPVANAAVNAMRYGYAAGARRFLNAGQNARDTTDDQGSFRLFGLSPGEYIVSANFRSGGGEVTDPSEEPSGYAPTYFPGTSNSSEAQRIRLDVSQEQSGINFALIATKLVRVSGSIINSQGAPVTGAALMLLPGDRTAGLLTGGNATRVDRDGTFRISNVAPGRYVLQVRTMPGGRGGRGGPAAAAAAAIQGEPEFGRLDLAVGAQDVDGVVVITAPGARVSGQIVSDTQQPLPIRPDQVQIGARVARPDVAGFPGGGAAMVRVGQDFTFQATGLFDPVIFRLNNAQGWWVKQVVLNGQDITDTPLEFAPGQSIAGLQIVLTDKSTTLQGAVTDDRGNLLTDGTVVVFPADEKLWMFQSRYIRTARPNQEGRYEIRGLPPHDDYLITVVQGLEDGQAGDPEFLNAIKATATRLSLNEGESKAADVKMSAR